MRAAVVEEISKPLVVRDVPDPECPPDGAIVLAGGDNSLGKSIPRMAESLREHGCANVRIEVIKDSGHFVAEEQPEAVAELIERYAALQKSKN